MMDPPILVEGTQSVMRGGESIRAERLLRGIGLTLALFALSLAPSAAATPIALSISGVVTFVSDAGGVLGDSVAVGVPFSGFVSFEPPGLTVVETDTRRIEQFPAPPADIRVSIGTFVVAVGQPLTRPVLEILIANDHDFRGRCAAPCDELVFAIPGPVAFPGGPARTLSFGFSDPTGEALSDLSIPSLPPDLGLFTGGLAAGESGLFSIQGRIDSVVLVPEPSSLLLCGAGLALLLARRRRRA